MEPLPKGGGSFWLDDLMVGVGPRVGGRLGTIVVGIGPRVRGRLGNGCLGTGWG